MRIASLVPSITESLLGLGVAPLRDDLDLCLDGIVARTEWCIRPVGVVEAVRSFGGTKNPRIAELIALKPDLILVDEEENRRVDYQALVDAGLRVHAFAVRSVEAASGMLRTLGSLCGVVAAAESMAADLDATLYAARSGSAARSERRPRLIPLIWHNPLMSVAATRYSGDLLTQAGFDVIGVEDSGYPRWTLDTLAEAAPDVLLLSAEPHDFSAEEAAALHEALDARGLSEVRVVKWEAGHELTWFGASSAEALRAFTRLRASV